MAAMTPVEEAFIFRAKMIGAEDRIQSFHRRLRSFRAFRNRVMEPPTLHDYVLQTVKCIEAEPYLFDMIRPQFEDLVNSVAADPTISNQQKWEGEFGEWLALCVFFRDSG